MAANHCVSVSVTLTMSLHKEDINFSNESCLIIIWCAFSFEAKQLNAKQAFLVYKKMTGPKGKTLSDTCFI